MTEAIVLECSSGAYISLLPTGASVYKFGLPDSRGRVENVVLSLPSEADYAINPSFLGCTVGRFSNRLSNAQIMIDGVTHSLAPSEGVNTLHGGPDHFGVRPWSVLNRTDDSVTFGIASHDGDQGFPGNVNVSVTYTLIGNGLTLLYEATTDAPTFVNLTNHAYFNLAGRGDVLGHGLQIHADRYTPVNADLLPTGEILPVKGTPFDFRHPVEIGTRVNERGEGFDENFVLSGDNPAVILHEPLSGRTLTMTTDQPGMQFYTGQYLQPEVNGFQPYAGLCLEPQYFPNSPNAFGLEPLRPGETYRHTTVWRWL